MAHALAATGRAFSCSSAATSCRRRTRTGVRKRSGSTCATGRPSAGSTSAAREFPPYTHYSVGGNTKFWGSVLYRLRREDFQADRARGRRVAGVADRLRHARAVLRARRAPLPRARPARRRSDRAAARTVSRIAPIPHAPGMAAIVEQLRAPGPAPVAAAARPHPPRRAGGCVLCNTCNSFPCKLHAKSDAEVCCVRPALAPAERRRSGRTRSRAACSPIRHGTQSRGGRRRAQRRDASASRRRSFVVSCGAVNSAALLLRSANDAHPRRLANSSGLVGRRYMAHLATMMQGFHPFRTNDTVFQKTVAINDFYLRGPDTPYPLGQIQSQGRTHGVMAQTVVPVDSAVGVRRVGRARRRLAGDVGGSAARRQPRHGRRRRPDPPALPAEQPRRARAARQRRRSASCSGSGSGWSWRTRTAARTRRTSAARCASAPTRARRCSIRTAAPTTSRTSSSWTRRSSPRRRR